MRSPLGSLQTSLSGAPAKIPAPDFSCYISEYKEINLSNIDSYKRGYELDNTRETNSESGHYQNQSLSKQSRDIWPLSLIPEEF